MELKPIIQQTNYKSRIILFSKVRDEEKNNLPVWRIRYPIRLRFKFSEFSSFSCVKIFQRIEGYAEKQSRPLCGSQTAFVHLAKRKNNFVIFGRLFIASSLSINEKINFAFKFTIDFFVNPQFIFSSFLKLQNKRNLLTPHFFLRKQSGVFRKYTTLWNLK